MLQKKIAQKKFYKKLIIIDPLIKNQIDPNDVQRAIRAFEIKKFTRKSITVWVKRTKILYDPTSFIKIYIDFPREELIKRIKNRVDQMFKEGAIFEVKNFSKSTESEKDSIRKKGISIIYQHHNLLSDFTALENVMMPLLNIGLSWNDSLDKARKTLSSVDL